MPLLECLPDVALYSARSAAWMRAPLREEALINPARDRFDAAVSVVRAFLEAHHLGVRFRC